MASSSRRRDTASTTSLSALVCDGEDSIGAGVPADVETIFVDFPIYREGIEGRYDRTDTLETPDGDGGRLGSGARPRLGGGFGSEQRPHEPFGLWLMVASIAERWPTTTSRPRNTHAGGGGGNGGGGSGGGIGGLGSGSGGCGAGGRGGSAHDAWELCVSLSTKVALTIRVPPYTWL